MKILVKFSLLAFALISFVQVSAQEKDYLDIKLEETKKRKSSFERELVEIADNTFKATIRTREEFVKAEGIYIFMDEKFMEHGEFVFYHSNGKVESRGMYNYGFKIGGWERYTTSGQRKADRYYNPESVDVIRNAMNE